MAMVAASQQWDDPSESTTVHEAMEWLVRGLEDGEEEGRIYGPQKATFWRLVSHYSRPELGGMDRAQYIEGFLQGVLRGIAGRQEPV